MPSEEITPLPIPQSNFRYEPTDIENLPKTPNKKAVLITDVTKHDTNLAQMIDVFQKQLPYPITQINLHEVMAKNAWCLGCVRCLITKECSKKDDFLESILEPIKSSDIIVVATAVQNRGISSTLKMFLDRTIALGHFPSLADQKPVVVLLVSGHLRYLPHVRQTLHSCFKRLGAADVMLLTDEDEDSKHLSSRLTALANEVAWTSESRLCIPDLFLDKAARVLVRDFVYTNRGVLPVDHLDFTRENLYDHLRPNIGNEIFNRIGVLATKFSFIRNWLAKNTQKVLIKNLQRAFSVELPWK
jgi:FMN-dependent NADH-azoreductase